MDIEETAPVDLLLVKIIRKNDTFHLLTLCITMSCTTQMAHTTGSRLEVISQYSNLIYTLVCCRLASYPGFCDGKESLVTTVCASV